MPMPWSDLINKFETIYKPPLARPATYRQVKQMCRELTRLEPATSFDLDEQLLARWVTETPENRKRSRSRQESMLRVIRMLVNFAINKPCLEVSPFVVKPFRKWIKAAAHRRKPQLRYKSGDDIWRMLHAADKLAAPFYAKSRWRVSEPGWGYARGQALIYTYAYTALRRNEALYALARNAELDRGLLTIEPVGEWQPKTIGSARTIPLAPPVVDVYRRWIPRCGANLTLRQAEEGRIWLFPGRRLMSPWLGAQNYKPIDYIRMVAEMAGVGDMTIIGFRKSLGTNAKAMGLGGLERRELLGHTDEQTGDWYDEERVETMRPAVAKIVSFYAPPQCAVAQA